MDRIILDRNQLAQLTQLSGQIPVYDEAGTMVGVFLPNEFMACWTGEKKVEVPFSEEELERFRRSGGGVSLAEFWQKMGVS